MKREIQDGKALKLKKRARPERCDCERGSVKFSTDDTSMWLKHFFTVTVLP